LFGERFGNFLSYLKSVICMFLLNRPGHFGLGTDGEYDTDHEEEELFEPEGRMNSPEDRMHSPEDMFDVDESTRG
jgi:hypothetical protein